LRGATSAHGGAAIIRRDKIQEITESRVRE
jgi:hypothetical protein